jgi:hypothetical protein
MQCFAMNTRRPPFKDWRVRRALALMLDFEWSNKNLFYGQYKRSASYFSNSEMAATGLPEGDELKVLEPFRGRVPDSVFKEPYTLPVYPGDGNIREGARQALALLKEAGWDFKGNDLVDKDGKAFRFEIITESPQFERIFLPYTRNLARIGIKAELRIIDPVQYQKRVEGFDFDMISDGFGQSESPGNEQRNYWSAAAADTAGSNNVVGIKDKAIDELVDDRLHAGRHVRHGPRGERLRHQPTQPSVIRRLEIENARVVELVERSMSGRRRCPAELSVRGDVLVRTTETSIAQKAIDVVVPGDQPLVPGLVVEDRVMVAELREDRVGIGDERGVGGPEPDLGGRRDHGTLPTASTIRSMSRSRSIASPTSTFGGRPASPSGSATVRPRVRPSPV